MSDRDLLEAAARAAGFAEAKWQDLRGWGEIRYGLSEAIWTGEDYWNALTDDGDALRLAVKLRLTVGVGLSGSSVSDVSRNPLAVNMHGDDPAAATRRAIVRAAAALTQPEGGA